MEGQGALPQATLRALSAFNFAVNRNATPDLSILAGWTHANAAAKIAEALPTASPEQIAQYVEALSSAVEKASSLLAPAAAPAAAAPAAAPAASSSSSSCPIDVAGIVAKAAQSAAPAAAAAPVAVAAAAALAAAPAAAPAAPSSSCPIDVSGIVKVAAARHSPPAPTPAPAPAAAAGPSSANPTLPSRPTGPGGLTALPQRTGPGPRPPGLQPSSGAAPGPAGMGSSLSSGLSAGMAAARSAAATASSAAASASSAASSAIAAATAPAPAVIEDDPNEPKEVKALRKKVQDIRIMLFRLAKRLDQNLRGSIINQVEYRLSLAERIKLTNPRAAAGQRRPSNFEAARQKAEELEAADPEGNLDFKCTVMLLGMTGVGKSATINSLLGEGTVPVSAFDTETKKVRVVSGMVHGVRMKFIDTPGLVPSASATGRNQRILSQAKGAFKRHKPDIVLYLDRMDNVRRSFGDLPLLRSITDMFGASMWFNTIVVLTHASTAPPEGPNGQISYDVYTNHRSHILQQTVRQAAGDMRLLNPVTYAENHPNCRTNQEGQPVLPNGVAWKQNLLLYIFSSKILSSTESVLKIQSTAQNQMMNPGSQKIPPLPYLLSNMIQTKVPRKAPDDEREILSTEEIERLGDEDRKTQMRKRREYEKMRSEEAKADADNKTQVSVPAPDPALQPTFDSDSNGHRYRFLESAGGWVVRPFVEAHGVDHDDGVEGFSCERGNMLRGKGQYLGGIPANAMFQLQKDKNNFSLNGEAEASCNHTRNIVSTGTVEVQTIGGRDMVYTSRLETRIRNHPKNKTAAGICMSRLAENHLPLKGPVAIGFKAEDKLKVMQGVKAIISAGMMSTKTRVGRETAKAANAELRLKGGPNMEKQLTVGGSLMHWRRDLLLGGNISSQYGLTDETTVTTRANLNSKATGSLQVRVTSHDYPILGVSMALPLCGFLYDKLFRGEVY